MAPGRAWSPSALQQGISHMRPMVFIDVDQDAVVAMVAEAMKNLTRRLTPRLWPKDPEVAAANRFYRENKPRWR